jgi:hypothetical protein
MPDSKVQMNVWRRELGLRVHAARKARMRRLSYDWLAGLREIVIDSQRCPLTFSEFTLKEFERDEEGTRWMTSPMVSIAASLGCGMRCPATCYGDDPLF